MATTPYFVSKIITGAVSSPAFHKAFGPLQEAYRQLSGYRQIGLVSDDLIDDLNPTVQQALKRLPQRLQYDRVFRQRRATQCSLSHTILPKSEWTKPEQDIHYLRPYIEEIERENRERAELDSLTKIRK